MRRSLLRVLRGAFRAPYAGPMIPRCDTGPTIARLALRPVLTPRPEDRASLLARGGP